MTVVTRVFISYAHDTKAHMKKVGALASCLREELPETIQVVIDQNLPPGGPDEGWPQWCAREVNQADRVLVVCSRKYKLCWENPQENLGRNTRRHRSGCGAASEATAISTFLYEERGRNSKCRAVLLKEADQDHIPEPLKPYHYFVWPKDHRELLDWVLKLEPTETRPAEEPEPNTAPIEPPSSEAPSTPLVAISAELGLEPESSPSRSSQEPRPNTAPIEPPRFGAPSAPPGATAAELGLEDESPLIAALPDLDAVRHYIHLRKPELARMRAARLVDKVWQPVAPAYRHHVRTDSWLRRALLRKELTYEDFLEKAASYIAKDDSVDRFCIALAGKATSGKSTMARRLARDLHARDPGRRVWIGSFNDFLLDKEERRPQGTEDPLGKFDLDGFKRVHAEIWNNKEVVRRPIYDQTGEGRLYFEVDPHGRLIVHNGNHVARSACSQHCLALQWRAQENRWLVSYVARTTSQKTLAGRPTQWTTGATDVEFTPGPAGEASLELIIRGQRHTVEHKPPKRYSLRAHVVGSEPLDALVLSAGQKIPVEELVPPTKPGVKEAYVAEGLLVLAATPWSLSAQVQVRERIRRLRHDDVDRIHFDLFRKRAHTEDVVIQRFHREALRGPPGVHFAVNNETLPEAVVANAAENRIADIAINQFAECGIDLPALLREADAKAEQELLRWVHRHARDQERSPRRVYSSDVTPPKPRAKTYWKRPYVTLALGQGLVMKFDMDQRGKKGTLSERTSSHMDALRRRSYGLTVGFQPLEFEGPIVFKYMIGNKTYETAVNKAHLAYDIDPIHDQLVQVVRREDFKAGYQWIDRFFDLQQRLWKVGLIETCPDLGYRYGIGLHEEEEALLAKGLRGIFSHEPKKDSQAEARIREIVETEGELRYPYHRAVPHVEDLSKFQRRFIQNSYLDRDYLKGIPSELHEYYAEQVHLRVPKDENELKYHFRFGEDWARAQEEQDTLRFRNTGVSSVVLDRARLDHVAEQLGRRSLERLATSFEGALRPLVTSERALDGRLPGTPRLAWAELYRRTSCALDPEGPIAAWAGTFVQRLSEEPTLSEEAAQALPGNDGLPWEKSVFGEFLRRTYQYAGTWDGFGKTLRECSEARDEQE